PRPCKMTPGPTAWAIRLPSILLESWSDRRVQRRCCRVVSKPRGQTHAALRQTNEIEESEMKTSRYARGLQAAFTGIALLGSVTIARPDIKESKFELVDQAVQAGPD